MKTKQLNVEANHDTPVNFIYKNIYDTDIVVEKEKVRVLRMLRGGTQTMDITAEPVVTTTDHEMISLEAAEKMPTHLCFFYIGPDNEMFDHFIDRFESGYRETSLAEAGKMLQQLYLSNNKIPDVLFFDIPLDLEQLNQFCTLLRSNLLLSSLPLIYIDKQLMDDQLNILNTRQLIDDVITIGSAHIDYYSKILFLKQTKLYSQLFVAADKASVKENPNTIPLLLKRAVDILIALICILLLSPVLVLVAIAIKLESKGPVFYTSPRAGKGFKVFRFYKFRSMKTNADKEVHKLAGFNQYTTSSTGPLFFKINNDPRITRIGKILRNTSADELPQLLNVLKGDMSIVGNRPLPIYEAITLTTNEFVERFIAPAGITGLWQVNKRGKAEMSSEERINLDITYSRNYNFLYDLKIIVKTPLAIFQKSDV